jgi:signal transduction histidine kinase
LQRAGSSNQLDKVSVDSVGSTRPSSVWNAKRLTRFQIASLIFLCWTAYGLFVTVPEMLANPIWRGVLLDKVFDSWAWALLTPGLILIDRRLAARQMIGIRLVMLLLVLSVPVVLVHTLLTAVLLYPFAEIWWSPFRSPNYTVFYFLGGLGVYGAVVGIMQALRFYNNYVTGQLQLERVQKSLVESRLIALRLHLEPHFLFNALNAISSEVAENPRLAREMIGDLGALLRRSLDCKDRVEIPLAQELAVLEHYLAIQRIRFGDRITFTVDVDPEAPAIPVPSMLLQPLVENAIRHGLEGRTTGGTIRISAVRAEGELKLEVIDNGVGLPRGWDLAAATGHGLRVTRERLAALYPEAGDACFNISALKSGGTKVSIRIPLQGEIRDGAAF